MPNKLFHREVFWPKRLDKILPFGIRKLEYTGHAKRAGHTDRYGFVTLPDSVDLSKAYIFEAEEKEKGKISKFAFRLSTRPEFDTVFVAMPENGSLIIKTVWINVKSDNHATLDKSKYANQ